jgi:hypothetical protein
MKRTIAIVLALAAATPALTAPPASDPAALVRRLYAHVTSDAAGPGDPLWWSYLTGRAAATFAHVLRVEKKTGDELVDADFLCQCQDPAGLRVTSVAITDRTPTHATAHVRFAFGDQPTREVRMTIELANDGRGWKIAEMTNGEGQSFSAENAEALKAYPGK